MCLFDIRFSMLELNDAVICFDGQRERIASRGRVRSVSKAATGEENMENGNAGIDQGTLPLLNFFLA